MERPNLGTIIETFIPIPVLVNATRIHLWQDYMDLLRAKVIPIVNDLRDRDVINWYCFLVHNRQSGVPTTDTDQGFYVHLRLGLTENAAERQLISELPSYCMMTRRMPVPTSGSLDNIQIDALRNGEVEYGWRILGEGSEWILKMLGDHDERARIPPQNAGQFLHYIGNALFTRMVQIPMP